MVSKGIPNSGLGIISLPSLAKVPPGDIFFLFLFQRDLRHFSLKKKSGCFEGAVSRADAAHGLPGPSATHIGISYILYYTYAIIYI